MKLQILMISAILMAGIGCSSTDISQSNNELEGPWIQILDQARWAQNAHNMQSWKLVQVDEMILQGGLDGGRLLPETDPISRQLILSLGALSEAAQTVAENMGMELTVQWIGPHGWDPRLNPEAMIFQWTLTPPSGGGETRHLSSLDGLTSPTVKYATQSGVFPLDEQQQLEDLYSNSGFRVEFINIEDERFAPLMDLAMESYEIEMEYEPTMLESLYNMRVGRRAREEKPYGISIVPNAPKGKAKFMEFLLSIFPLKASSFGETSIDMFNDAVEPTQQVVVMYTHGNTPQQQFEAGIPMQALWMDALVQGYTLLPLSQGIQEYVQVAEQYQAFHELLAEEGETIQMILAVNRPQDGEFQHSPRLAVSDILF